MWEFFIKNSKFANLFIIVLIALGLYSISVIPRESSPEVVIPIGIVTTVLTGAPAADIESLVTNKIERGLSSLTNVKKITSTSREGVSSIIVEFDAEADIDTSITDLKDTLDSIERDLPSDVTGPFVSKVDFVNQPILSISFSGDLDDRNFITLSDNIEDEIESVSGVSRVVKQGVSEREVTVIVNQTALEQFSIDLNKISNAIRNANTTFPIGQIKQSGIIYNIAFEGDITDTAQISNIGITTRGGQPVFIRDVATVIDGTAPVASLSRLSVNGSPSQKAISFDVYKQSGGDITRIAKDVNGLIRDLQEPGKLLEEITAVTNLDAGEQIETDLMRLSFSGIQTVFLVILLLIVTIGWREGLLAGAAIPLSFLFGFIGLYLSGNTINFLSLFSLILGIGILVDSAIVMVEGINRRMKDDLTIDKKQAAIAAIREFSAPLISGTLTTVAMFTGLFIVSGVTGQFIASIPFTLIFLLLASLFVSLAIIPLLASRFLHRKNTSVFEEKQVIYAHKLETWYKAKLAGIIGHPHKEKRFMWGIRIALVLVLLLPVFGVVKVVFFEQSDVDFIITEIEKPEGTTKETTDIAVRRVEEILYSEPNIESFVVTVGSGSQFTNGGTGEKLANILISLKKGREETSTEIVEKLRTEFTSLRDIRVSVNQPSDGPPTGADIVVKFLGNDLNEITRIANESVEILKSIEHSVNVEASTNSNNTEFVLELDRAKTAALGLNPFTISQIAHAAVFGTDATSLTSLASDIDVVVKLNIENLKDVTSDTTNETNINALGRITIPTQNGNIPLSSLVRVSMRESSSVINHEDNKRIVSVTSDVTTLGNVRDIQAEALQRIKNEIAIPEGVIISSGGGETDESNKAFQEMFLALIVGVLLMIGILVLQFNSYLHTRYVLSILPYSLIGIMIGLAITKNSLSFPSIMGFIALSGIVVNNSILLIDMMNKMRKENPEKPIRDVVIDSAGNRLRPILLTTITTVIGMIPLTYAGDLWAPLAYAVMFGLVFSVVITLVLIPIVYDRRPGDIG
ncbi:MAG: efflux RND transporter permease subunit [Candidatus Pacebacteria bacterium]|nr:efflux RND transporter permease subunit [Candidatus Paceibacterota bacterium]MCF7857185.1 efflux RND transporter permease subunit [Candidatus Paceibacterota bacterium]